MRRLLAAVGAAAFVSVAAFAWRIGDSRKSPEPLQLPTVTPGWSRFFNRSLEHAARPAPHSTVRVCLTESPPQRLEVAIDGAWTMRPVGNIRPLAEGEADSNFVIESTSRGLRVGGRLLSTSRLEIVPRSDPAIWVGDHQYRGRVLVFRRPGERLMAVNHVALEDYVASVVDSEMPAAFPPAAREAQAIVARTYALYQQENAGPQALFDVYASIRSQRYLGFQYRDATGRRLAGETKDGREAARKTAGVVCTWQGRLLCTYYSAVCGGRTTPGTSVFADAARPLQSVPCEWCREAPRYRWVKTLSADAVLRALDHPFHQPGSGRRPRLVVPRDSTSALWIESNGGRQSFSAEELRRWLGPGTLPSPRFTVAVEQQVLTFTGRGHGHGVGLCQWGARGQALADRSATQILQHYYPGIRITRLSAESQPSNSGTP